MTLSLAEYYTRYRNSGGTHATFLHNNATVPIHIATQLQLQYELKCMSKQSKEERPFYSYTCRDCTKTLLYNNCSKWKVHIYLKNGNTEVGIAVESSKLVWCKPCFDEPSQYGSE